jgi:predicted N-acetyltransferase YhbS
MQNANRTWGKSFFYIEGFMDKSSAVLIRHARTSDFASVRTVTEAAFLSSAWGHNGEAELIERLRSRCAELLSLVAECEGQIVGHVLFSPVVIEAHGPLGGGLGLGPIAVAPEFQGKGIGSRLIEHGLELLRQRGVRFVCVLGEPAFYGRFRFQPAAEFGVYCEFGGDMDGAFQIIWLQDAPARTGRALAKYRPEFSDLPSGPTSDDAPLE